MVRITAISTARTDTFLGEGGGVFIFLISLEVSAPLQSHLGRDSGGATSVDADS